MSARDSILARLRNGVANQQAGRSRAELPPLAELPQAQWKSQFMALMSSNHAELYECSEAQVVDTLVSVLNSKQIRTLGMGEQERNQPLQQALMAAIPGLDAQLMTTAVEADAASATRSWLFEGLQAGLTHARAALAETGSLVIETGPEEPRTLSLVPPLSIVLVRESSLMSGVTALMQQQTGQRMPTNLLLVSGPSKTADIQQTLAYGAHGPKELVIVWITDGTGE